jgi:hypothetical protein
MGGWGGGAVNRVKRGVKMGVCAGRGRGEGEQGRGEGEGESEERVRSGCEMGRGGPCTAIPPSLRGVRAVRKSFVFSSG